MKDMEELFDDSNLEKYIKKAKKRTNFKIVLIAIGVFVVGSILNSIIGFIYSQKSFARNEAYIKLTVPNGYISESNDIVGFLGGNGTYKISKNVGGKSVALEDRISLFGPIPPMNYMRSQGGGGGYHNAGDWPVSLWQNGYKRMLFFHPELEYKKYQNDLENLGNIPDDKIIEMGISFDKPYKINQLFIIQDNIKSGIINWLWLDEFTEKSMEEFKYEIENYDAKATGISEDEILGISYDNDYELSNGVYNQKYDGLLELLSKSNYINHREIYEDINTKGKTKVEDAEILGVVVQGTKEELKDLIGNPMIKASSFGIIVDPLY